MKSAKFGNSDDLFWLKTVDTVPLRVFTAAVFFSYHEASVLLYFNVSKLSILGCSFRSIVVHLQMFLLMHPQCVCAHASRRISGVTTPRSSEKGMFSPALLGNYHRRDAYRRRTQAFHCERCGIKEADLGGKIRISDG